MVICYKQQIIQPDGITTLTLIVGQVYIESAADVVDEANCVTFDDQFNWVAPMVPAQ
jgi:hypothetical protein